jgi:hypothetical protein
MRKVLLTGFVCAALCCCAAQLANNAPETFTAFAVNMNSRAAGTATSQVDIHVQRYSTDKERDQLMDAFNNGGQDRLLPKAAARSFC